MSLKRAFNDIKCSFSRTYKVVCCTKTSIRNVAVAIYSFYSISRFFRYIYLLQLQFYNPAHYWFCGFVVLTKHCKIQQLTWNPVFSTLAMSQWCHQPLYACKDSIFKLSFEWQFGKHFTTLFHLDKIHLAEGPFI